MVRYALSSQEEANRVVRVAEELQITDLYVQVYALGQAWYPSKVAVVCPRLKKQNDHFALLLEQAKKAGMRVHAWINVFFIWANDRPPVDKKHPFNRFRGSVLYPKEEQLLKPYAWFKKQGIEGFFIDPFDQQYRQYITDLITELVYRYDLDGIHLDYLRYPEKEVTFSPAGRTGFRQSYFVDPLKIMRRQEEYVKRYGLEGIADFYSVYRTFLERNIDIFLQTVQRHLKSLNGKLLLTCAVKADARQAANKYYQNWKFWLGNNLCDEIVMMNYLPDIQIFSDNLNRAAAIEEHKKIRIGIAMYNQSPDSVRQKLSLVHSSVFDGFALFSYNYLSEQPGYFSRIKAIIAKEKSMKK